MLSAHKVRLMLKILDEVSVSTPGTRHQLGLVTEWLLEAALTNVAVEPVQMKEAA